MDLRIEAERFRRLAKQMGDRETRERLLTMADEFDRWADEGRNADGRFSEPQTEPSVSSSPN